MSSPGRLVSRIGDPTHSSADEIAEHILTTTSTDSDGISSLLPGISAFFDGQSLAVPASTIRRTTIAKSHPYPSAMKTSQYTTMQPRGTTHWRQYKDAPIPRLSIPLVGANTTPTTHSSGVRSYPWVSSPVILIIGNPIEFTQRLLANLGCNTVHVPNDVEAFGEMKSQEYDMVLMDDVWPLFDASSTIQKIRAAHDMIPIVIMSEAYYPGYNGGVNDILFKPFYEEDLYRKLEKHLRHLLVVQDTPELSRGPDPSGGNAGVIRFTLDDLFHSKPDAGPLPEMKNAPARHPPRRARDNDLRYAPYDSTFSRRSSFWKIRDGTPQMGQPTHKHVLSGRQDPFKSSLAPAEGDCYQAFILESATTMELLQDWLDKNPEHYLRPKGIHKLMSTSTKSDQDPPTMLFIDGVRLDKEAVPVAGGSFADVFRGSYQGHDVAVKRFRVFLSSAESSKLYKRFYREALLWRQLRHPNILSFLGVDRDAQKESGHMCMISPWMMQGTLMEYLRRVDHLTAINHKRLITDIAAGLDYLHRQPFIHGDLHGSNVFINEQHRALLGDFGLTALAEYAHLAPTTTINKAGAIRWLSPELILQDDGLPPRKTKSGDIFAFGRICLSIFTRLTPFHAIHADARVLLEVIGHRHPRRPGREDCHGAVLPDSLWDLVSRCWQADPVARPDIGYFLEVVNDIAF